MNPADPQGRGARRWGPGTPTAPGACEPATPTEPTGSGPPTTTDPARAAAALRAGALVAFPTETVYGLGADARRDEAVARIFLAKARPPDNPLIVHLATFAALLEFAGSGARGRLEALARAGAARGWIPGPLTVVVDRPPGLAPAVSAGLGSVALRVPAHPLARALLAAAELPVAAPLANRSGRPSPTRAEHVIAELGAHVDLVLDGGSCAVGLESTVVDLRGPAPLVLRPGPIELAALREVWPDISTSTAPDAASPGTRHRHYAPRARVVLVPAPGPPGPGGAAADGRPGDPPPPGPADRPRRAWIGLAAPPAEAGDLEAVFRPGSLAEYAAGLYDALRAAESRGCGEIWCELPAAGPGAEALRDRLQRAAAR